jgi:DNA polymerase gamma 1
MIVRQCDNDKDRWSLTEEGESLLLTMGLETGNSKTLDRLQLYEVMRAMGNVRMPPTTSDSKAVWMDMVKQLTSRSVWHGGAESHTFNRLEAIALDWQPKTPVLQCKITRVLEVCIELGSFKCIELCSIE